MKDKFIIENIKDYIIQQKDEILEEINIFFDRGYKVINSYGIIVGVMPKGLTHSEEEKYISLVTHYLYLNKMLEKEES